MKLHDTRTGVTKDVTPDELQAIQQILVAMMLQGGSMEACEFWDRKQVLWIGHVGFQDNELVSDTGSTYTITPKGIAFVEQGE